VTALIDHRLDPSPASANEAAHATAAPLRPVLLTRRLRAIATDEAWIGLGTNLGDREQNLQRALSSFGDAVVLWSPIFETEPWGIREQPWFLNAVALLHWTGTAHSLLQRCLAIEEELGRVREEPNGPRIIDLDVLAHGGRRIDDLRLSLPHPGIISRRSVLEPWAAVAPDLIVPGQQLPLEMLRDRAQTLRGQAIRPRQKRN
jgi:2-amino-4-hydroxy-6-hydroxymethyldihydropteridine diphosphokinase